MPRKIDPYRASKVISALMTDLNNDGLVYNDGVKRRLIKDKWYQDAKEDLIQMKGYFDDLSDEEEKIRQSEPSEIPTRRRRWWPF